MRYSDRAEAGRILGRALQRLSGRDDVVVLGLPRGGVPVAFEIARMLDAPLDIFVVIEHVTERERRELERRERAYRGARAPLDVEGRVAVLVDDGLATGASMRAAVAALRKLDPARIVVAVPVGSAETCALMRREADEVVCPLVPLNFQAVGLWYDDFGQTTDAQVQAALVATHA
jgi:predicted phosphoribosyltransferase